MSTRTSKPVNTDSNTSNINPVIASFPPILYSSDSVLNRNYIDDELECLICMSTVEMPVLQACGIHSLCYPCISKFFEYQKNESFGYRSVHCPRCGEDSGALRVRKPEQFRVNRELERVRRAYEREKSLWINDKIRLETQLNYVKKRKEEEKLKEKKSPKRLSKKGLSENEQKNLKELLESFNIDQLNEVKQLFLENIDKREKEFLTPVKKRGTLAKLELSEATCESESKGAEKKGSFTKGSTSQRRVLVYCVKTKVSKEYRLARSNIGKSEGPETNNRILRSFKKLKTDRI